MEMLRYTAFSDDPAGGNPAGIVLDAAGITDAEMLAAAAAAGYSESAFLIERPDGDHDVRYFSPLAEVPFCGHATIATAAAYASAHGPGTLRLHTRTGLVAVETSIGDDGIATATLTSVPGRTAGLAPGDLAALLEILGWSPDDLDPALPPRVAYAGAWHPIIAARTRERLGKLDYDLETLGLLMAARGWTTIDLVWRESAALYHARNPFPPGGIFEDPATGAAAAAFGGYLRDLGLVSPPATITILQGYDLGRPSRLTVDVPAAADAGIAVTGKAVPLN